MMESMGTKTNCSSSSSSSSKNNERPNGVDALLEAAMEGRADDAVQILRNEPELIRIGNAEWDTAFHLAARAGREGTVRKMIELLDKAHWETLKHVLRQGNAQGNTPLHLALKYGHKEVAVDLARADRGAIYLRNDDKVSPFDLAKQAGNQEVLDLVKEKGFQASVLLSDIEMRLARTALTDNDEDDDDEDEEDWIRLFKAARNGKDDMVMEILEEDQDIIHFVEGNGQTTVFHVAASNGQAGTLKKMAEFMKSSSDMKRLMLKADCNGNTALHLALLAGYEDVAHYLIEVAPRAIYKLNKDGFSPLYLAVKSGCPHLVRYMTKADISPSIRDRILEHAKNDSIAHLALKKRNQDVLKAIMEGLPELINSTDKKGWKPLSYAAYKGYLVEVSYILETFQNCISEEDGDGSFPIHKAVAGGHVNVVKEILLRCPQAQYDVDKKGRNLVDIATMYQSKDILSYLRDQKQFPA